jgi:hypothetical protein
MAQEQWWERFKTHPKWLFWASLVGLIIFMGLGFYQVERGSNRIAAAVMACIFGFHLWAFWYERRKRADSQQAEPEKRVGERARRSKV